MKIRRTLTFVFILFLIGFSVSYTEEGQWLLNNLPFKYLRDVYGFEPTSEWLEHAQKAAVRFPSGSGSFVSSDGLILTNHHIAAECVQNLSTAEHNYYDNGFLARNRAEETKCPNYSVEVLMEIRDVTEKINSAVIPAMSLAEAFAARRAVMATIAKEAAETTDLFPQIVTLYQGGLYHLYLYKRYDDVRLVFAPEESIAMFGGDPDNFEYPRYVLDCALLRAYENDRPLKPAHYFKWSSGGAGEDELVFILGNPGSTSRNVTVADLTFQRDVSMPFVLNYLHNLEIAYQQYGYGGKEEKRIARWPLFTVQNSRKAYAGMLQALQDPEFFEKKVAEEQELVDLVRNDPDMKAKYGDAWAAVASTIDEATSIYKERFLVARGRGINSQLFEMARTIVVLAEERQKPNDQRKYGYTDTSVQELVSELLTDIPIDKDFELAKLKNSLSFLVAELGYESPIVRKILAGKSPAERAYELVNGTTLESVATRKRLIENDEALVLSDDPMIKLAVLIEGDADTYRMQSTVEAINEVNTQAYAKIAKVRWARYGTTTYPDATFTLRLAFGQVKGYAEDGQNIAYQTVFDGLYKRAGEHDWQSPWLMPQRWVRRKKKIDLSTPFNFVLTTDLIGGNSGSPVINRRGEIVGLIFDGNIQSLAWDFAYTEDEARGVAVHSSAIREALLKIYDAAFLARELGR